MLQLQINEKGGQPRQESFDKSEITIGRVQGNDIVLPKGNISKRHSRIVVKDGKFIIVDLKSTNGTYVNGKKITAPQVVKTTDKIYIGDFTIQLTPPAAAAERQASMRAPASEPEGQEIDLFGGDAPLEAPSAAARGGGTPGLIDDNFDQEFDAPEPPQPKLPKPSKRAAPKLPEPEPELELDADFDAPDLEPELELDVSADDEFDLDAELSPEPDLAPEPEPEPAPEAELEVELDAEPTPRPSIMPKSKRTQRAGPSRIRPLPSSRSKADESQPSIDLDSDALAAPTLKPAPAEPVPTPAPAVAGPVQVAAVASAAPSTPPPGRTEVVSYLHNHIVETLGLSNLPLAGLGAQREAALQTAERAAEALEQRGLLPPGDDAASLAKIAAARAVDLQVLADLMSDEAVVEIEMTPDGQLLVDRDGRLESVEGGVESANQIVELIHTLAALGGQQAGEDDPLVDVRLSDGSRVVASLPPMAFRGPSLSVRKTTRDFFTLDKLLEYTTISQPMMVFIDACIRFRKNILLSAGPGVGPTATMNALLGQMPSDERLVSIENGIELHLGSARNLTSMEPRGGYDVADLVRHAIAMQADRALIGGLDGAGAADILRSLAGPLEGSVLAYSASSPANAVERLAQNELSGHADGRRLIAQAFPVVLHEQRFLDNSRRISSVAEVVMDGDEVRVEEIFTFTPEGVDENLIVTGTFAATGYTPRFLEELVDRGEAEVDLSIFKA